MQECRIQLIPATAPSELSPGCNKSHPIPFSTLVQRSLAKISQDCARLLLKRKGKPIVAPPRETMPYSLMVDGNGWLVPWLNGFAAGSHFDAELNFPSESCETTVRTQIAIQGGCVSGQPMRIQRPAEDSSVAIFSLFRNFCEIQLNFS